MDVLGFPRYEFHPLRLEDSTLETTKKVQYNTISYNSFVPSISRHNMHMLRDSSSDREATNCAVEMCCAHRGTYFCHPRIHKEWWLWNMDGPGTDAQECVCGYAVEYPPDVHGQAKKK